MTYTGKEAPLRREWEDRRHKRNEPITKVSEASWQKVLEFRRKEAEREKQRELDREKEKERQKEKERERQSGSGSSKHKRGGGE